MFIVLKNLLYIGNKLSQRGVNQTTIETLGPLLEREGFAVSYASSKKNKFLRMLDMIWSVLRNPKTDFVIIDTYSTFNFWYAFVISQLCRLFQLKYIPFLHGGNLPRRLHQNPKMSKMIFNNSFCNVSPSHYLLDTFHKKGFYKSIYIPNAIEINQYPFIARINIRPKLLWVRAFAEIYNPMMAIEVLKGLKNKYPEATLCMVGPDKDGSLSVVQKRASALGLNVVFTGKLTKLEWVSLAKEYDFFINTTHFDNTPVSVIEAMALGLAVVSTNVGGIPFLLENNKEAILVADNASNAMIEGIEKLLENSVFYKEIIDKSRTKVALFDWESVKQKWHEILR
jgi:L-malate glycosyltransferase